MNGDKITDNAKVLETNSTLQKVFYADRQQLR